MSEASRRLSRAHLHPSPESGFLSRQQVSERYGFSVSYLANLPRSALWYHKVGAKVFYEAKDVEAFIRGQGQMSPPDHALSAKPRGRPRKLPIAVSSGRAMGKAAQP